MALWGCGKAVRGALLLPMAWDPVTLDADESCALCLHFFYHNVSATRRSIVKVLHECRVLDLSFWQKPVYQRAQTDDEPSDTDDDDATERKQQRRAQREQTNAACLAHASFLYQVMRFQRVQTLHLTNVNSEYGCRLVRDVRKSFARHGFFRVTEQPEGSGTYALISEDRAPEPLAIEDIRAKNQTRALDAITRPDQYRWLVGQYSVKEDALSAKEALLLQEFQVVVKVWNDRGKPEFHFSRGTSLRHIRKGEAREIYADVLAGLRTRYPAWAQHLPPPQDSPSKLHRQLMGASPIGART